MGIQRESEREREREGERAIVRARTHTDTHTHNAAGGAMPVHCAAGAAAPGDCGHIQHRLAPALVRCREREGASERASDKKQRAGSENQSHAVAGNQVIAHQQIPPAVAGNRPCRSRGVPAAE